VSVSVTIVIIKRNILYQSGHSKSLASKSATFCILCIGAWNSRPPRWHNFGSTESDPFPNFHGGKICKYEKKIETFDGQTVVTWQLLAVPGNWGKYHFISTCLFNILGKKGINPCHVPCYTYRPVMPVFSTPVKKRVPPLFIKIFV
jgi:hypothetical protein